MNCPICQAKPVDEKHVSDCHKIEMGLLQAQVTPVVDKLPEGYDILPKKKLLRKWRE